MQNILNKAASIKLVIFDVDGVLTDGRLFFGDDGQEYKSFYARDGLGMKLLLKSGVEIAIITARSSELVKHRMKNLGIRHLYQGRLDKLSAFEELVTKLGVEPDTVAYVGDDIVDLPVMRRVGLPITVQNGHPLVVEHSDWQTPHSGGAGAARDVCELIMRAQNTLDEQFAPFLV